MNRDDLSIETKLLTSSDPYPVRDTENQISQGNVKLLRYFDLASIKEIQIKTGHGTFYKGYIVNGRIILRKTAINYDLGLEGHERSLTRHWEIETITDGYGYLMRESLTKEGGVFFGCSDGESDFPLKDFQKYSTQIVTEIDDLSRDEQLKVYQWFAEISGLKFYLISSGGKSIHLHLLLNERTPIDKVVYLRRLICILLDGDPAVTRPHQPFRLPTFYRKEKGSYQEILQEGENYSFEEVLEGIKKGFKALGYRFPNLISDRWFTHLTSILNSDKVTKGRKAKPVTKEEKLENLRKALECGEKGFNESLKKDQKKLIAKAEKYNSNYEVNLTDSEMENFILELVNHIPPKRKDDGLYEIYRGIFTVPKNILGLSRAIEIANSHSPKESGWDQVLASSTGSFTIGTLIFYAKEWGGWTPSHNDDFIDPEHGKVICSGKDAIARAKQSVTEDDINEHTIMSLSEFREALENKEFTEYQERFIRYVNKLTKGKENGFAERFVKIPVNFTDRIVYDPQTFYYLSVNDIKPDTQLIIPKQYKDPKVYARILTYLNYIGLKHIYLNLGTGEGKSTCVSYLDKVIYIDTNYNNPSNPLIKEFRQLTPRTEFGIYEVNGEIKVDPPKKVRDKADQPDSGVILLKEGNCELKSVFRAFQAKGYSAEGNKAICEKCHNNKTCPSVSGGFRFETKQDMSIISNKGQGRLHPSQLTPEKIKTAFPTFIKVWEEASTLPVTTDYLYSELTIRRLRSVVESVAKHTPDFNPQLAEYLLTCLDFLAEICDANKAKLLNPDNRYFGLPHEVITSHLPNLDESIIDGFLDDDVQHLLSILCPDIADLVPHYQGLDDLNIKVEELSNNLDTSPYHLLMALLFGNDSQYCLSTSKIETKSGTQWQVMVTEPVTKWGAISKVGGVNTYMDATGTPTQIKAIFDIDDDTPFLTITTETTDLDNLFVRNINMKGMGSNTWSEDAIARAKKAVAFIQEKNPNKRLAVMTLKKYAEEFNTPFWYGKSDRGSNELIGYDGIIFVGSPFPDVGAVKREYVSLFKHRTDKPTFDQFYAQKRYEQRMQGLGRSRAQHFRDKQFMQFYLTTNEDLSYLQEIGVEYQTIEAEMLSPELGSKGSKTLSEIFTVAKNFVTSGVDFTLSLIAKEIGKTKQGISKAIKGICSGFEEFKSCQLNLYNYYIGEVDEKPSFQHFPPNETPDDLIRYAIDAVQYNMSNGFMELVKGFGLPKDLAYRLLWAVSGLFDPRIPETFLNFSEV